MCVGLPKTEEAATLCIVFIEREQEIKKRKVHIMGPL